MLLIRHMGHAMWLAPHQLRGWSSLLVGCGQCSKEGMLLTESMACTTAQEAQWLLSLLGTQQVAREPGAVVRGTGEFKRARGPLLLWSEGAADGAWAGVGTAVRGQPEGSLWGMHATEALSGCCSKAAT